MFKIILIASAVIVVANAASFSSDRESNLPPTPYNFGYEFTDNFGKQGRQESGDASGAVKGSYILSTAGGLQRLVEYVADANGFRAMVKSNEPGVDGSSPASVLMDVAAASALPPVPTFNANPSSFSISGANSFRSTDSRFPSVLGFSGAPAVPAAPIAPATTSFNANSLYASLPYRRW